MSTAYCYDPLYLAHNYPGHPENRARLERVMAQLEHDGLLDRMAAIRPQPVTLPALERIHSPSYIASVRALAERGGGHLDLDTYLSGASFDAAMLAAGGCVDVTAAVLRGEATNGIALVRPPGHHAKPGRGMGFCLFNNIAVAAAAALQEFGLSRVLIVDWDVHHGNGTQDAFYDSPNVLYFSTHQYPHYPGTGHLSETGRGPGRGSTVNVPLSPQVGDAGFRTIYKDLLCPFAERYRPELILVSAGYDAHWNDPLANLGLSLSGFRWLADLVVGLAQHLCEGRLVVALEGGYNLDVLAPGVASTCRALLGEDEPGPDRMGPSPYREPPVDALVAELRQLHGLQTES